MNGNDNSSFGTGIPDANRVAPAPASLSNTAAGPQLGGYSISLDLYKVIRALEDTSNRQDLVEALRRLIVDILVAQAQRELNEAVARGVEKISQPSFWARLFRRK